MELTKEQKKEILVRCEENIRHYHALCDIAIDEIEMMRCSLDFACPELYDGMLEQYEEWCEDNDITPDEDFDVEEELFFFDPDYD